MKAFTVVLLSCLAVANAQVKLKDLSKNTYCRITPWSILKKLFCLLCKKRHVSYQMITTLSSYILNPNCLYTETLPKNQNILHITLKKKLTC
jgi:hypothetical protein